MRAMVCIDKLTLEYRKEMKRKHLWQRICFVSCGLLLTAGVYAEIPTGYYAKAEGLSDSLLRQALYDTIRGGVRIHYGTQGYGYYDGIYYPGTWNYFPQTDVRADGTVWDMYSNTKRYFPHDGGSACGLEIEHCLPKSWWGWTSSDTGSSKRAYQDLFILNPSDGSANGNKSNYPPGHVVKGDKFDNGSFRMDAAKSSQYGWICFEPAEEYRGDFARTYFYVATAYADLPFGAGNADYQRYLTDSTYFVFKPWLVEVLLDWHRADPVSEKERKRAEVIYSIQGNRNPYIDYPALVEYIWGDKKGQAVDFSTLVCTATDTYQPAEDCTDLVLLAADDVTEEGFTVSWSDCSGTYTLDVFHRQEIGSWDTIVNMPAMGSSHIKASDKVKTNGNTSTTAAGTNAITMGVSDRDGAIIVYDLGLTLPALLQFRSGIYKTATAGELQIFFNNHTTADTTIILPTSRDEIWYSIPLAAGIDSVTILSVGGSTTKRACMQALYVLQGDYAVSQTSIEGFPCTLNDVASYYVHLPEQRSDSIYYYSITNDKGNYREKTVLISHSEPMMLQNTHDEREPIRKYINGQQIVIEREHKKYSVLGTQVSRLR